MRLMMSAKGVKENVSVNMVNIVMVVYRVSYYGKTLISRAIVIFLKDKYLLEVELIVSCIYK